MENDAMDTVANVKIAAINPKSKRPIQGDVARSGTNASISAIETDMLHTV